jgi:hypothetical protein
VSPIPEDGILHSHRREILKSYRLNHSSRRHRFKNRKGRGVGWWEDVTSYMDAAVCEKRVAISDLHGNFTEKTSVCLSNTAVTFKESGEADNELAPLVPKARLRDNWGVVRGNCRQSNESL